MCVPDACVLVVGERLVDGGQHGADVGVRLHLPHVRALRVQALHLLLGDRERGGVRIGEWLSVNMIGYGGGIGSEETHVCDWLMDVLHI